ncbi:hypothetical protein LXL04_031777 [Taraxacum kok-saghyz]
MFKKSVEAKAQQRLSGADRKKLKRTIKERFPNASDTDLDTLIPPKVEVTVSKHPNRVLIYSLEGGLPIFFDVDSRGTTIFPTVYALWKVPHLLPAFILKGGEVSRYMIGGADLMFPGISIDSEGLPEFLAGQPWAVKVPGNPAPFAVGSTCMSSSEALKAGLRGKALKITHHYRDALWESAEGRYVPNAGFLEDVVFGDPSFSTTDPSSDQENIIDNQELEASIDDLDANYPDSSSKVDPTQQVRTDLGDLKVTDNAESDKGVADDQNTLSVEDVDALLDKCLLQAFYTSLKDKDLPIAGSTLWANHVLPCRPPGTVLDIKKSSHKKLSKWLQSKSSEGLISSKEDKHKKEVMVVSINRKHPLYTSFKPSKQQIEKPEQQIADPTIETDTNTTMEVIEIYKPSVHVNPIFTSVGADTRQLYTASEASQVVYAYVEKENLVKPTNKSVVVLDAILCDALFKGAIKKGTTYPSEIHKKDLGPSFVSRMQAHHQVVRGKESVVRKGGLKPLQIMTERRQGNKKVTKVSGMESFLIDAETFASELQKKFACSTSVTELPGKKGYEVLIQGGVIDVLARYLVEQYGIPKKYIEVLDKTARK